MVAKNQHVHFEDGEDMNAGYDQQPEIMNKIFIPNWGNKPPDLPPVLTLGGLSILTHQNITAIIAKQGMGKSSNCESILASYLNPAADCLGYNVDKDCKGVIYIDFERTTGDVWNSFYRMCRRAGISIGANFTGVQIAGMRAIPRLAERIEAIECLLQNNPCSLLLLTSFTHRFPSSLSLLLRGSLVYRPPPAAADGPRVLHTV